ncbi:MAG: winged helix-turn-helix domain-containing protein, partial [Devosia sp.]
MPLGRRGLLLLQTLLRRRGEVVSKAELIDAAWPNEAVEESNLPVQMAKLRKAVGSDRIRTVERVGYQFVDVTDAAPASPMRRGNIDRHFVDCVMRVNETAAVVELAKAHRVTSVVGPGGVGKTTLALAAAKDLETSFRDGVWVVDLASLTNATTLESVVMEALGITSRADVSQRDAIVGGLSDKNVLLVLDNCEHVVDAVTTMLRAILAGGPEVRVLASTQVPLGVAGEHLFKLAPFGLGRADRDSPALGFVAHCYAAQGETLKDSEWAVVERLSREFDGLALPLKLVASQAAIMGLAAVEQQLHRRPDGAAVGRGSLRGSLEWSYGLLTEDQRRVFRSLGVFHGGFSPAAVAEVGGEGADVALEDLVRRSIVVRDGAGGGRFRLLEPFRRFALELLGAAGEEEETRRRHAKYVSAFFRQGLDLWQTLPDDEWAELHRPESANLRSALDWAEKTADWTQLAALTAAS